MLCNLQIENIAIIEKTSVDFTQGFTCLTGETGAGKSILIDAINAVLGEKTSRELIRTGESQASVSALFSEVSEFVLSILREEGLPEEPDGSLLLQRKMYRDGRNVCKINGELVTVSMLRKVGMRLVNIHGQRDSQELLNPEKHVVFLDLFADKQDDLNAYLEAYNTCRKLNAQMKKLAAMEHDKERRMDLLRYQIEELEAASIKPGEQEALQERKKRIRNIGILSAALTGAFEALNTAVSASDTAYMHIEEAARISKSIAALNGTFGEALSILRDTRDETESLIGQLEDGETDIDSLESRLDLLYKLSKKYGETEEAMLAYLASCKQEYSSITTAEETLLALQAEYARCETEMQNRAKRVSANRKKAAKLLANRIDEELHFLDMPSAVFVVEQTEIPCGENGADAIRFLISANPGEEPKPLVKVASGGELSRVMLAIKNVLASIDGVGTLVFDEIDAGVSGRAAEKIGRKLAQAAQMQQVLCITHLSQIAARADAHYLIEKSITGEKTFTKVHRLSYAERVDELARMNGGITLTEVHRASARQLLKECGQGEEISWNSF